MKKRLISLLLAFSMVISLLPVNAFANRWGTITYVDISITDGYPTASAHGTAACADSDGYWKFTPSSDPEHPENGIVELNEIYGQYCFKGTSAANPVKCKVYFNATHDFASYLSEGYFAGEVEIGSSGMIDGGTYYGTVLLNPQKAYLSSIRKGTFYGPVVANTRYSEIIGGTFHNTVTLNGGYITTTTSVPVFAADSTFICTSGTVAGGCFLGTIQGDPEIAGGMFLSEPTNVASTSHVWKLTTVSGNYTFNNCMTLSPSSPLYVVGGTYRDGPWADTTTDKFYYDLTSNVSQKAQYINSSSGTTSGSNISYAITNEGGTSAGSLSFIPRFSSYDNRTNVYTFQIKENATVTFEQSLSPLVIGENGYPTLSNGGTTAITAEQTDNVWAFTPSTDTAHPENGTLYLYQGHFDLQNPVTCKVELTLASPSQSGEPVIQSGTFNGKVSVKFGYIEAGTFNQPVTVTRGSIHGGTFQGTVDVTASDTSSYRYICGGEFYQSVTLSGSHADIRSYSDVPDATFHNTVTLNNGAQITAGRFTDVVNEGGTINGGLFQGTVTGTVTKGMFQTKPSAVDISSHTWTLTAAGDTYQFNDFLTLSSGNPLYVVDTSTSVVEYRLTSGELNYVNAAGKTSSTTGAVYNTDKFEFAEEGTIELHKQNDGSKETNIYFSLSADKTVLLQSSLVPLEIESNGYPKSTEGGTIARSGLGWAFTPSTTGDPADGVLTLTGSDLALGSNPVECKVVLKGAGDHSYASIASGTFNNTVTLEPYAALKDGIYNGAVSSNGTSYIYGGTFNNTVDFNYGFICGGTFNKPVSSNLNISNGIFMDTVTLKYPGILAGGIYAGDVKLSTFDEFRHGGLFATLPDGLPADNLVWTLTTSGDDSYTFGGVLTLDKDHPLYLASSYTAQYASSNTTKYPITSSAHDLKYANQIALSSTGDTVITTNGTACGTITADTDNYQFALTQSATVLLQSALDPLWIDETGYPVGTNGGENSYTGEGWSYSQYGMHGTIKGKLTLSSGTFTINSDVLTQCDVEVETDVTLNGGDFAGRVSSRGVIANGTFRNSVELLNATGSRVNESTIRGGIFTETSEVTIRNNSFISGGDFSGKVELNWGAISGGTFTETSEVTVTGGNSSTITNGTFNGTVDSKGQINGGTFNGTVTNHGPISAGTFTGEVNNSGRINDGAFSGTVNNNGAIYDGTLTGKVNNNHLILGGTFEGPVTNRLTIEFGTFTDSVTNYGTIMGAEFRGEVLNDTDPEDAQSSGIIKFSTEPGVYAPPLFTETSRVTNTGNAKILDGTFLGTVTGTVEGGVYINKPESTNPISRMTYRYQDSEGNGKTDVLTINYKIEDAAYVVRSDTTHAYVTLTSKASPLKNINGDPFSEYACAPLTWALYGKLPDAEQIILNKATEFEASDLTFVVPDDTDNDGKIIYDGQPHEARFETPEVLDYLLGSGIYELNDEGGLKVYYCRSGSSADDSTDTAPTEIGTYTVLFKKNGDWQTGGWTFEITENIHTVTVTDGFIVKVEHPGAVDADEDTTGEPVSTAEVLFGDTVTVTIDATKFPSGMVFDRWETSPVDLQLTSADGESYKTVTFTMPAENVTLKAVPCTVEEKAASGGSSPLGTAALVVVGGAAAGVLVWQGYELGTELYLHSVLPSGVAIPETRGQLAVVLWQAAGSPAPAAPLAPDAADTQKAMAWVVEHALIEDKTGNFDPREPVSKTEVIRAWNKLHEQGLAKQAQ